MSVRTFIERQIVGSWQVGRSTYAKKLDRGLRVAIKLSAYALAVPAMMVIRMMRPLILVRMGGLVSPRLGHFAADTELYLCERDAGVSLPGSRHVDLFYMDGRVCNLQLATMWRRILHCWPSWLLSPIHRVNRLIPGGAVHEIDSPAQHDRDVHNLLDRLPPHLKFTLEEEVRGEFGLRAMGITPGTPFVCLNVRDSAYLSTHDKSNDRSYHAYRDSDVQNYVLAAEELANRGYFVIRMGATVREAIKTTHPGVIDYATNGMRSDFMDIYLGAKCEFCFSVGSGFDAVPMIFRRPIAYVNYVPLGYLPTFRSRLLGITKHHLSQVDNRTLAFAEIVSAGVGVALHAADYELNGMKLVDNTPEELRDVAIEMAERLSGTWQAQEGDEELQRRFWEIFPTDAVDALQGHPLHGEIRGRFGAAFLRKNRNLLQ